MFNTIINHSREHVPYTKNIEVTEHRAPTDQSIEVLNEMEEKITKQIAQKIITDNNIFSTAIAFVKDEMTIRNQIVAKFTLNGKDYVYTYDYKRFKKPEENMNLFISGFSDMVSIKIISESFKNADQSFLNSISLLGK